MKTLIILLIAILLPISAIAQTPETPSRESVPMGKTEFLAKSNMIKSYADKCGQIMAQAHQYISSDGGLTLLPDIESRMPEIEMKSDAAGKWCVKAWLERVFFLDEIIRRSYDSSLD